MGNSQHGSLEQFLNESTTTYKYKNSVPKDFENILKKLEIYHVMSFSSKKSSSNPNLKSNVNEDMLMAIKQEEKEDLSFTNKKPIMVESEVDLDVQSNLMNNNKSLLTRILRIKDMLVNKQLSEKLHQGVQLIELRLRDIDEKFRKISEMTKLSITDLGKYKSSEKDESGSKARKPGFTSQFSSYRSIDQGRSSDMFEIKSPIVEDNMQVPGEEMSEEKESPREQKEPAKRVLFGNEKKRTSRFLLREFINKNFEPKSQTLKMLSPFEKKVPLNFEVVKEVEGQRESEIQSNKGFTGLELENLRLKNQLDNTIERTNKLENDLEEGKKGLERLLESMPRKVKQNPLLKMGDKHFREILELVKFQVEEYKEVIKEFKQQTKTDLSLEEDSDGENTEDLVGTSVMNSKNISSRQSNEGVRKQWTWEDDEEKIVEKNNEIPIKFLDNKNYGKQIV